MAPPILTHINNLIIPQMEYVLTIYCTPHELPCVLFSLQHTIQLILYGLRDRRKIPGKIGLIR